MADDGYPDEGEYIIGTVDNIFKQGAFIKLDEYEGKKGLLHLSEISLKWVRNIHDYVKEGQKVVLLVLRVKPDRGHIDLSLRRVADAKRKEKLQEVKQRQRAEKLFELLAKDLKVKTETLERDIGSKLLDRYETLYKGLEAISADNTVADDLDIKPKWKKKFVELVSKSIKPPYVEITGYAELRSYDPGGVEHVKKALKAMKKEETEDTTVTINYISAPIYSISVRSTDYKTAEKALKDSIEKGITYIKKHNGEGEFHRHLKETEK